MLPSTSSVSAPALAPVPAPAPVNILPAPMDGPTGAPTTSMAHMHEGAMLPTRLDMNEKVTAAFSQVDPDCLGFNSDAWDEAESLALTWDLALPSSEAAALSVINLLVLLYTNTRDISSLSVHQLRSVGGALRLHGLNGLKKSELVSSLEGLFYSEEKIKSLSPEIFLSATQQELVEWTARVGLTPSANHEDNRQALLNWKNTTSKFQEENTALRLFGESEPPKKRAKGEEYFLLNQQHQRLVPEQGGVHSLLERTTGNRLRRGHVVVFVKGTLGAASALFSYFVITDDYRNAAWIGGIDVDESLVGLSRQGSTFVTCIPETCSVLVLNQRGVEHLSPQLDEDWHTRILPYHESYVDLTSAREETDLRALAQSRALSEFTEKGGSLARLDRDEEARPVKIAMGNERFGRISGYSGKFDSEGAFSSLIVGVPAEDRHLLGVTRPYLRLLLMFIFSYDLKTHGKPEGTHLRAFHDNSGSEFKYVSQISRALQTLARVGDALLHDDPDVLFLRRAITPLVLLLERGGDSGLRNLRVTFVEKEVSDCLMKLGPIMRSPQADTWTREELCSKLTAAMTLQISSVVSRGALFQMNNPLPIATRPRGRLTRNDDSSRAVSSTFVKNSKSGVCFHQVQFHLGVVRKECSSNDKCRWDHNVASLSQPQLRKVADSIRNESLRKTMIDAIERKFKG